MPFKLEAAQVTILTAFDHPGSAKSSSTARDALRALLNPHLVLSSPLTRAVQTTLIGLEPLLARYDRMVKVAVLARP